jgi:hypothetical protein
MLIDKIDREVAAAIDSPQTNRTAKYQDCVQRIARTDCAQGNVLNIFVVNTHPSHRSREINP